MAAATKSPPASLSPPTTFLHPPLLRLCASSFLVLPRFFWVLYTYLEKGSSNIFCKGSDSKYFQLWAIHFVMITQLCPRNSKAAIDNKEMNGYGCSPIRLNLHNQLWFLGCNLGILDFRQFMNFLKCLPIDISSPNNTEDSVVVISVFGGPGS